MAEKKKTTPQEMITSIREAFCPPTRSVEYNKLLCEKYPFLKWYGDPLYMGYSEDHELDYRYTWEDELPEGWKKALCPQMWDDLKAILEKRNYVDKFRFNQIKEKYGTLRLNFDGAPKDIMDELLKWAFKYENLSEKVCIECGEPSTKMTLGWITYVCDNCSKHQRYISIPIGDIDKYYENPEEYREKHKEELQLQKS